MASAASRSGRNEACRRAADMLTRRDTTSVRYITPAKDSSMTMPRAIGVTGRMSLRPTLDSTATLRNRSSIHVRVAAVLGDAEAAGD